MPASAQSAEGSDVRSSSQAVEFLDLAGVDLGRGFWGDRVRLNERTTIPHSFEQCEITGRISNFEKAAGLIEGSHEGFFFNDSDVYKVIEGAAYSLMLEPDPKLERDVDDLIDKIAAAQEEDGYLNTYYTLAEPEKKWTDIRNRHELYCAGHLFEAAVAYERATGKRTLLDVATRLADHIDAVFGPGKNAHPPGHEEIEVGLVRLYGATGDRRYLDLADFFLQQRGNARGHELYGQYAQDHEPVVAQDEAVGHAVRACYLYMGMADVVAVTGNREYRRALDQLWENVISKKFYITGSVGASRAGEAFSENYELENKSAYAETCAAIANGLWQTRMFRLDPDAKYIDILERVMYNGFLSGVSLSGDRFFYPNPLACDGRTPFNHGSTDRSPWFGCACCPPNICRFMPSLAGFAYAHDGQSRIFVTLFMDGSARLTLSDQAVGIVQETQYPWNGDVRLTVKPENRPNADFDLYLRIPGWAQGRPVPSDLYDYVDLSIGGAADVVSIQRNGETVPIEIRKGFVRLSGPWKDEEVIELHLPMPIRRVRARHEVEADRGRVAIERGPIVYCIEGADYDDGRVETIVLKNDIPLQAKYESELLGGVVAIAGQAMRFVRDEDGNVVREPVVLTAIPYYVWNNRGANEMEVWIASDEAVVPKPPRPTVASQARPSASHCWTNDTVSALNDQEEPESSHNQDIPRQTWWPRRGTVEWVQYDFDEPTEISQSSVYWFDDTGIGQCRIPQSWRVAYRDAANDEWRPVKARDEYEIAVDQFCTVRFEPVRTTGLRIEVQLRPEYSGGILEWKLE